MLFQHQYNESLKEKSPLNRHTKRYSPIKTTLRQPNLMKNVNILSSSEWTGRDLNPRLPRCERDKTTSFIPVLTFDPEDLPKFAEFMRINMRLETRTVRDTVGIIKRFLEGSKNKVTYDAVETYLKSYLEKKPKTYNSQITALRRFICDFLKKKEMIESFKMAVVDTLKTVKFQPNNKCI
jgi:hypothetical protein